MTHKGLKFSLAGVVLVAAVAYLGFAGVQKGWVYTLPVDQYVANVEQQRSRVRLCGTVAEQDLVINKGQLSAKFIIKGETGSEVKVAYKGVVPDMFKAGAEVVVEGKRNEAGVFVADVLMTKCASKYEEKPTNHPDGAATKPDAMQVK
jgi:cytochrome c-type biogenesis protein CcmE